MYAKYDDNPAGEVFLDFMIDNTVGGASAGLPKYFFDKIRDSDKIKANFTKELADFFARQHMFDFGSSWNRFLVDYGIKDLVTKQLGYALFDGMTNDVKISLYHHYPEKELPLFDGITRESY